MDEWQSYLVVFDTDRIKEYVFATNRLKEIRGASALLTQLNEDQTEKTIKSVCLDAEVFYRAGGGAAALVPDLASAQRAIAAVEKLYRDETCAASISGAYLEPMSVHADRFGERMQQAGQRLRRVKAQKAELAALPVEPYMRLCDSCGRQAAKTRDEDDKNKWLCAACHIKRRHGERSAMYEKFRTYVEPEGSNHRWPSKALPRDLDTIGLVSSPLNYVGFIAADGNRIGELLCGLKSKNDYAQYAGRLDTIVQDELTFQALRRHGQPRTLSEERFVAPFEIILVGGDDVLLITAADIAIQAALKIAEGFEAHSTELLQFVAENKRPDKMTMAVGVVLAHADFPLPAMHELAEALQKSAKRYCAKDKYKSGAIDFLVVSGGDTDLDAARAAIPHRRPYALQDLRKVLDSIAHLKRVDFPMSQLQAVYQALFAESAIPGTMATLRALGSAKEEQRKALEQLLAVFPPKKPEYGWPWVEIDAQAPHKRQTVLTDLVELYPFIHPEGGPDGTGQN